MAGLWQVNRTVGSKSSYLEKSNLLSFPTSPNVLYIEEIGDW